MSKRRVVISGLGIISGIGKNVNEFWDSIINCRSGVAPIELVDRTQLRCQNGVEVKNYDSSNYFELNELDMLERNSQFAMIAAREAVADAQIQWNEDLQQKTCIILGTTIGGQDAHDNMFADLYKNNQKRLHPLTIPRLMPNSAASSLSMAFGVTGATFSISTACASGNHAIGNAYWMVRNGIYDMALTGASETPFSYGYIKGWEGLRVFSPDTCRPFSKNRRGIVFGEGAAILVLETLESAKRRGSKIYGEIIGFGMSADASHFTKPLQEGAERAISLALKDAEILPEKIDYINAHGTGTQINDSMETAAIRHIFGAKADDMPVSSTKSMHGHALSATSALEAVATTLGIASGILPPTANFIEKDEACDLDVVPNEAREKNISYAMSNAFAFGGLNAVLVFKKFE